MGTDIYDRIYEQLKALGLTPLEAETWVELIFQISDITKTDPEDVKGPILTTLATGKMDYAALNSLQGKGVQLTGILSSLTGFGFPEVVTGGHVGSFLLKIALKQYVDNHKTGELEDLEDAEEINKSDRLGKRFEAFFKKNNETSWPINASEVGKQSMEKHQADHFGTENQFGDSHKLEIYPNAVLIDGKRVPVRKHGVHIHNYADRGELMTVSIELMPSEVTIHQNPYKDARNETD